MGQVRSWLAPVHRRARVRCDVSGPLSQVMAFGCGLTPISEMAPRSANIQMHQGDWRSGSALRSHRRGHWFEPSIAHDVDRRLVPPKCGGRVAIVILCGCASLAAGRGLRHPHPLAVVDAGVRARLASCRRSRSTVRGRHSRFRVGSDREHRRRRKDLVQE
jgi:hypothetical protein